MYYLKAEYLEALNKEELAKKKLDSVKPMLEKMEKEIKKERGGVKELEEMVQEQEELLCKYGAWTSTVSWTSIKLEQALLNKYRTWTSTVEQVSSLNKHCWTSLKLEQALQLDKHFYNKLFLISYKSNLIHRIEKKTVPAIALGRFAWFLANLSSSEFFDHLLSDV